jgi:capsule polysaccharide export protein KpsE/RkpR
VTQRLLDLVNDFNLQQRQTRGRVRRVFLAGRVDSTRADLDRATRVLRDFEVLNRDWTQSPTLKARHADLQRQQGIAEDLYVSTRREYEQARVAEVNDAALITVIDSPVQPEKKQFPRIGLTLGVATVLGTVVGGLVAILGAAAADWERADPLARRAVAAALAQARADVRRLRRG